MCSDVLFLETLVLEGYFLSTNGGVGEALNIGFGCPVVSVERLAAKKWSHVYLLQWGLSL